MREPTVPLVAFNQMNNNLMRLIEQEGKARREHEERIAKLFGEFIKEAREVIITALKPVVYEPSPVPIHVSPEEEDVAYAKAIGMLDKDGYKEALGEVLFMQSQGQIDGLDIHVE